MNIVARIVAFVNNFFQTCAKYSRPTWEFRIRFAGEVRAWIIEMHENGDQRWIAMMHQPEQAAGQQVVLTFKSYQAAHAHAVEIGLHMAYEQAYFTHDRHSLHPAANAAENAMIEATAKASGVTPIRERVTGRVPSSYTR